MDDPFVVAGITLMAGAGALFVGGPLGMLLLGGVLVTVGFFGLERDETHEPTVNCSSCGAVNPRDNAVCHHCESRLEGA
ncbi:zinc ribbon domain-containing protein [Haloarchaeobius sp. HRN-SO-5]|uniref:zinc ribbon domain-containing protein n=1 Tax=Haloarchaeobius sp. HRN-SO-5 TaxID=3446118 RepID=UPI003EBC24B6